MDGGYLEHGQQRFESFALRKLRPTVKLTAITRSLLMQPENAVVKIRAIRHCVFSPFAMETDDVDDDDLEVDNTNDGAPSPVMSLNRKGFLIAPKSMQTVLENTSHPATIRINAIFSPTIDAMVCDDGIIDSSILDTINMEESKETMAAKKFSEINSLPRTKNSIYKKKESSHQNIDSDLQRSCKENSCRSHCRRFDLIFNSEMSRNRLKRLQQVSTCKNLIFYKCFIFFKCMLE